MRFFACPRSEFLRIEITNVCRVRLGPARGGAFLHGDGNLRVGFAVAGKETARLAHHDLILPTGENPRSDLAIFNSEVASAADGARTILRRELCGSFDEAVDLAVSLPAGKRQKARIFRLAAREAKRRFDSSAKRIFVDAIGGSAGSAVVDDRSNGNREALLSHVLMNSVVGEARERAGNLLDVHFRPVRHGGFGEAQDGIDDSTMRGKVAHLFENAAPMLTLRNRAGEAPWPVPIVSMAWPLPHLCVPPRAPSSIFQTPTHNFQKLVELP